MLTQIKEDILRILQEIDPETQGAGTTFCQLCTVCELLVRELVPALPAAADNDEDECLIDGVFHLSAAAEGLAAALRAAASLPADVDERADWPGFIQDSDRLKEEADKKRQLLYCLVEKATLLPEREVVWKERDELARQKTACHELYRGLADLEPGWAADTTKLNAHWMEGLAEWRREARETTEDLLRLLDNRFNMLSQVERWLGVVDIVRKQLKDIVLSSAVTPSATEDSLDRGAESKGKAEILNGEAFPSGKENKMQEILKLEFEGIHKDWVAGKWLAVLAGYDRVIEIHPDNERARFERPIALFCLMEELRLKSGTYNRKHRSYAEQTTSTLLSSSPDGNGMLKTMQSPKSVEECVDDVRESAMEETTEKGNYAGSERRDEIFFTSRFQSEGPQNARTSCGDTDFAGLLQKPSPPWDDECEYEKSWRPFFEKVSGLTLEEQRYAGEFIDAYKKCRDES